MATDMRTLTIRTTSGFLNLNVEIADTEAKRAQGLMFRKELPKDAGMLFLYEDEGPRTFWMKNTPLSLDMLFISKGKKIVYIEEDTIPFSTALTQPEVPAMYVLEVNSGYCAKHHVAVGDRIDF